MISFGLSLSGWFILDRNSAQDSQIALKPMRRVLVSDGIIDHIKQLIVEGKLRPGDPLPSEIKMASQMNVGRSTVREALKVLIHLGLIKRVNKAAIVAYDVQEKVYPHDIVERLQKHRNVVEMVETRKIIEPDIAELAAARRTPEDIERLREDMEAMEATQNDVELFIIHDHHFHLRLAQASRNNILIEIIRGLQENLVLNQAHILRQSDTIMPRSLDFHKDIFKAVADGKPKIAKKLMFGHVLDIEREMYAIFNKGESDSNAARKE